MVRRVAIAGATQGVFEYVVVEAALRSFFQRHPAERASPIERRGGQNDAPLRKNKTLTLLPEIIRQVAIAAATWDVFEYEVVEAALETHLRQLVSSSL